MTKATWAPILLILFYLAAPIPVWGDEILVVVSQAYAGEKISMKQLANIYRRKTIINEGGERWNPINLSASDPVRIAFAQKVFQQSPEMMEAYWNTQYFQGIMPPYAVSSVEAMIRVLESAPASIGYLLPCQLDKRVKTILKITVAESFADLCAQKPE